MINPTMARVHTATTAEELNALVAKVPEAAGLLRERINLVRTMLQDVRDEGTPHALDGWLRVAVKDLGVVERRIGNFIPGDLWALNHLETEALRLAELTFG